MTNFGLLESGIFVEPEIKKDVIKIALRKIIPFFLIDFLFLSDYGVLIQTVPQLFLLQINNNESLIII